MSRVLEDGEVQDEIIDRYDAGELERVGGIEPNREMKWTGWEVVKYEGDLYALAVDRDGDVFAVEQILESELSYYTE